MEKLTRAQLNNALMATDAPLQRRLSNADGLHLSSLLEKAQRRWPNQDNSETIEEMLADFESLSLKYSLPIVEAAIERLRIAPSQRFFPTPSDVAEEIEAKRETGNYDADNRAGERRKAREAAELAVIAPWRARLSASGLTASEFIDLEAREEAERAESKTA